MDVWQVTTIHYLMTFTIGSIFFRGRPGHWATHRTRRPKKTISARLACHWQYTCYNLLRHSSCWSHPITSTVGEQKLGTLSLLRGPSMGMNPLKKGPHLKRVSCILFSIKHVPIGNIYLYIYILLKKKETEEIYLDRCHHR